MNKEEDFVSSILFEAETEFNNEIILVKYLINLASIFDIFRSN